jgi:hypothetical protein
LSDGDAGPFAVRLYVRMTDTRYWLRAVWLDAADVAGSYRTSRSSTVEILVANPGCLGNDEAPIHQDWRQRANSGWSSNPPAKFDH